MKQSSRGLPSKKLEKMARQGQRVRFSGGWLNETPRDREIAHWLDEHRNEAWPVIKELLYYHITGKLYVRSDDKQGQPGEEQSSQHLGSGASILSEFDT